MKHVKINQEVFMQISTKSLKIIVAVLYFSLGLFVCYGLATDVPNTAGYVKSVDK